MKCLDCNASGVELHEVVTAFSVVKPVVLCEDCLLDRAMIEQFEVNNV